MLACNNNAKSRYVKSRLLEERLSMSKLGLKCLYKAVIFDLGGSLVNLDSYSDYENLNKIVQSQIEKQVPSELDNESDLDFLRVGMSKLQKLNIDDLKQQLSDGTSLTMNENIYNAIKKLQNHGLKISIIGNNDFWARSRNHNQSVLEESQNLEACSTDLNQNVTKKDQSEIFEKLLSNLQVKPTACIFVDQLLSNLRSAEQFGITAIYSDKNQENKESIQQLGSLLNLDLH